jgi:hypothetical protein
MSAFKRFCHSILHAERSARQFQRRNKSLQIAKLNLSYFEENSVISFLIEICRRLNAPATPFYTLNVAHAKISVDRIPADRKTKSFKFRRKLCYFAPDWDISAFKRSFHSILHAERSARQFQRWNNHCKSQNASFQVSTITLFYRSWWRYFGV